MNQLIDAETVNQRTDAWYTARIGKATASRIGDIMAKTKTGPSASRKNYMAELVCERLTGLKADSYMSASMQHGVETEAEARQSYEIETFQAVIECGFYIAPDIAESGASPDGLINEDGLIEIKCPNTATHIETLLNSTIDNKYFLQMQWQMYCTGRKWCDFVSYDNRLPDNLRLFIKRVERDDKLIEEIKTEVVKFLAEVDDTVKRLIGLKEAA